MAADAERVAHTERKHHVVAYLILIVMLVAIAGQQILGQAIHAPSHTGPGVKAAKRFPWVIAELAKRGAQRDGLVGAVLRRFHARLAIYDC